MDSRIAKALATIFMMGQEQILSAVQDDPTLSGEQSDLMLLALSDGVQACHAYLDDYTPPTPYSEKVD